MTATERSAVAGGARRRVGQSSPWLGQGNRQTVDFAGREGGRHNGNLLSLGALWRPPSRPQPHHRLGTPRRARGYLVPRAFARDAYDPRLAVEVDGQDDAALIGSDRTACPLWRDDPKSLESLTVEATIASKQGIALSESVGTNEQVCYDSEPRSTGCTSEIPPESPGLCSGLLGNWLELDSEQIEGFVERSLRLKMSSNFSPDDVTRNERTGVVGESQCLARSGSVDRVGTQNIQKNG